MWRPPQDDPRYVWHALDGLRARAATGLGCVQAGAQKLAAIEASYASAIIGVVDRPLFRREGTTQPKAGLLHHHRKSMNIKELRIRTWVNASDCPARSYAQSVAP